MAHAEGQRVFCSSATFQLLVGFLCCSPAHGKCISDGLHPTSVLCDDMMHSSFDKALVVASARLSNWIYSPLVPLNTEYVGDARVRYTVLQIIEGNNVSEDTQKATVLVHISQLRRLKPRYENKCVVFDSELESPSYRREIFVTLCEKNPLLTNKELYLSGNQLKTERDDGLCLEGCNSTGSLDMRLCMTRNNSHQQWHFNGKQLMINEQNRRLRKCLDYDIKRKVAYVRRCDGSPTQEWHFADKSSHRVLAIVYRGTTSIQDWMQNVGVVPNKVRFHEYGLGVHSGIHALVENDVCEHGHALFARLYDLARSVSLLLFTGHSLGGGMANVAHLFAFMAATNPMLLPCISNEATSLTQDVRLLLRRARAITFAAPMVFVPHTRPAGSLCIWFPWCGRRLGRHLWYRSINFVLNNDPVPRLPAHTDYIETLAGRAGGVFLHLAGLTSMAKLVTDGAPVVTRYRHIGVVMLLRRQDSVVYVHRDSMHLLREHRSPTSSAGFVNWWTNNTLAAIEDHYMANILQVSVDMLSNQ